MKRMTFREIFDEDVRLQKANGTKPLMSKATFDAIRENFAYFTEEERVRCVAFYYEFDLNSTLEAKKNGTPNDHKYLKYLWGTLNSFGKGYMIKYIDELGADFFYDCIANMHDNKDVKDYFEKLGLSNEELVKKVYRYRNVDSFDGISTKEMERRSKIALAMGISEEDIKKNPILLAIDSEILNARKNAYEQFSGKAISMGHEGIKFLTMPDSNFERLWGAKIRDFAKESNIGKYRKYFKNGEIYSDKDRIIRTYALIQEMHREKEKEKEREVTEHFFEDGIAANELKQKWDNILPAGKSKSGPGTDTEDIKIGLSGAAGTDEKKDKFWQRMTEKFGTDAKFTGISFSQQGKSQKVVKYLVIDVGAYTVLEPVGQPKNATYVIASEFKDFLPEITRDGAKEMGVAFQVNHDKNLGRYDYESDKLFKIIDALEEYQTKEGQGFTREEHFRAMERAEAAGKIVRERFADSHLLSIAAKLGVLEQEQSAVKKTEKFVKERAKSTGGKKKNNNGGEIE